MSHPITSIIFDYETLDSDPRNPVVIEIGLIAVTRPAATPLGEPLRIVDRLDLKPNHLLQLMDGRTFSRETLEWHVKKGTLPTTVGTVTLADCTKQVATFIERINPYRIWCWGKDFERTIYEGMCGEAGLALPEYQFRKFACGRDHWQTAFGMEQRPAERSHIAIQDCESETQDILKALTQLKALHAF